ncbi:MAG: thioredoxin domain-containing protein [Bacteroidia bacterium]
MTSSSDNRIPNLLINETSPYLLQHAYNPVQWYPWGEEALGKARAEQKLILVSVGYSACHWCHVMEHESFEDEKVARIMNDLFVCIKVDREERPDIDQVYMTAVQIMTGQGGWPLNCFTLPDGRPLYGGTYFPKQRWTEVLLNLADLWKNEPEKCMQYATELTSGVKAVEKLVPDENREPLSELVPAMSWEHWETRVDSAEGGPNRAPKFPLPNNYLFLLRYFFHSGKESAWKHTETTLDKMADGGIYDQIGGGFARYSTDMMWKVPHFEKMLYDNAQLVSLYAEAFQFSKKQRYKDVVYQTLRFVEREMTAPEGCFYSALDADSEGEEGKFYVWQYDELKQILGDDFAITADYYNINSIGHWEHGNYILLKRECDEAVAAKHAVTVHELHARMERVNELLLSYRNKRIRPGLDDKTLTSWNALMIKGYADAFLVFHEPEFLHAALKAARFIRDVQMRADGGLWHSWKKGKSTINAFLEDYAFTIEAFIKLYEASDDEEWLQLAHQLTHYAIDHFTDEETGMFFFTSDEDPALIARKYELSDNVIPSSCSQMAVNLFHLGHYFGKTAWIERSAKMLRYVQKEMIGYGAGYSNWLMLQLKFTQPFRETVIVGKSVDKIKAQFREHYLPNQIFACSSKPSALPLLKDRYTDEKTLIYICENNTCGLPLEDAAEAIGLLSRR